MRKIDIKILKKMLKSLSVNANNIPHVYANYVDKQRSHPLLKELRIFFPEYATLIAKLTTSNARHRRNDVFRLEIKNNLIPYLPLWSELKDEGYLKYDFLERRLYGHNLKEYDFKNDIVVKNGFMAFYSGGLRVGGLEGQLNHRIIVTSPKSARYLGELSLVTTEKETFLCEGTHLVFKSVYQNEDVLGKITSQFDDFIGREFEYWRGHGDKPITFYHFTEM